MTTGDLPFEPRRSAHSVGHDRSSQYEIRVHGRLAPRWASWFDGMELARSDDGTTVIRGPVADQAALHGLLGRLRDLGVPLLSLTEVRADASTGPIDPYHPPAHPSQHPGATT